MRVISKAMENICWRTHEFPYVVFSWGEDWLGLLARFMSCVMCALSPFFIFFCSVDVCPCWDCWSLCGNRTKLEPALPWVPVGLAAGKC